jgi:hypothetical protein
VLTVMRMQRLGITPHEGGTFIRLFNFNSGSNFISVFSAAIHSFSFLLLVLIATSAITSRRQRKYWWGLAGIFAFFALDEIILVRATLFSSARRLIGMFGLHTFYLIALLVWIFLLVAGYLFLTRFLIRLPKNVRFMFMVAGIIFVTGAIGMDGLGRHYALNHPQDYLYAMMYTLEEAMEMAGVILFIHALLTYCAGYTTTSRIQLNLFMGPDAPQAIRQRSLAGKEMD